MHRIDVCTSEETVVRDILRMHHGAHHHEHDIAGAAHPAIAQLSGREAEVLALIARGYMNKEIADRLHISLPTVNTHRKNICEKLGVKSVPALTVYAVMHGYVELRQIEGKG